MNIDRAPYPETRSNHIPEPTMTNIDATAETPITLAALDDLFNDAADLILLAQDLRSKIDTMRRQLAPTDDGESSDDEPRLSRLFFG
jgi:hypothetical protein